MNERCQWIEDTASGEYVYDTSCGHTFSLDEGTLPENAIRYCFYCGREIEAK